jgi:multimeric flavodoxin WrbA
MPQQSRAHVYLEWTKQRIDEMDATLASLETKAGQMSAESKAMAERLLAQLKKRREEFQAKAKSNAQESEAVLQASQAQLETLWVDFEAQVKAYFETTGKHFEQQQATFRAVAAAQTKAWREAADHLQAEAMKVAVAKRADIDVAIKQMKVQAAEAEVHFQKLKQAGGESWSALSAALAQSRKTFGRATREAWDAVNRAGTPKS